MKKIIKYIIGFFIMPLSLLAQGYPVLSNYYMDRHSINPAYAGYNKHLTSSLYYKNNWFGFPGSPKTGFFSAHTPVFGSSALGVLCVFDQLAIKANNKFYLDYVYRISFAESSLAFGLRGGIEQVKFDWSAIESVEPKDPVFSSPDELYSMPNFGLGILYNANNYYIGISVPEILTYQQDEYSKPGTSYNDFQYYQFIMTSGLVYPVRNTTFSPSSMVCYSAKYGFYADLFLKAGFSDIFSVGAGYRFGQSMIFFVEYPVNKQLRIGYAFDYSTTKLSHYSYGSHEIMVNFQFIYSEQSVSPRF